VKLAADRVLRLLDDTALELIIFPTEQCNFRCVYCYEDFALGRMAPEVVQGIRSLLDRRVEAGLRRLRLSWFGGEPLLAENVVLDISRHANELARDASFDYRSAMSTNGSRLTPEVCERLVACGVRHYQISLDGWGEAHDRTRRRRNGTGTFDRIWANLRAMKGSSLDFTVALRVHCSPANRAGVEELVAGINAELQDPRFTVRFQTIEHLGGPHDATFEIYSGAQAAEAIAQLEALLAAPDQAETAPYDPAAGYICYASNPTSLTVRSDGTLGKCTVALASPRNRVGRLARDGTITVDQAKLRQWIRGIETRDAATLACPARGMPE
jgi:uncharacterized protein